MTITGKILIVFNLLAATGMLYLASEDWAQRMAWSYVVFRDERKLLGLPLDKYEADPFDNVRVVDKMSDHTLRETFGSSGEPVHTQLEEVERLQRRVTEALNALPDEASKRKAWVELFAPLANNPAEQEAVRDRAADPKVTWTDLEKDVHDLFADVLKPVLDEQDKVSPAPGLNRPPLNDMLPRDKRQAVAHLLFNVHVKKDDASIEANHMRMAIVVGLGTFSEEARHQAEVLHGMMEQTVLMTLGDRAGFEVDYKATLDDLRDRAESIASRKLDLKAQEKLKDEHTKLKEDREKDVAKAKEELAKARKAQLEALHLQEQQEEVLFRMQRYLGSSKTENERLERLVRRLEGLKPR